MNSVMRIFSIFLLSTFVMFVSAFNANIVFAGIETGVDVGQKAAPFKLLTVDGKELELESFAKRQSNIAGFWCDMVSCMQT